ncbi:hypothetical protein ORV05_23690 [Amycolatopsis cynarae]|uniref:Uncharacterized protein n=1 Tax=Amycolatopsis cynarae TaxID=2995223 RepID=A0ABY7AVK7_9PSEU|nr:hypothetical protein [Amycolatopsis sp. HUAS 11-8]WAL63981.1 hypothetical protein ORV05_23690 [Amycolatopsis sp. HUAS 11-8]
MTTCRVHRLPRYSLEALCRMPLEELERPDVCLRCGEVLDVPSGFRVWQGQCYYGPRVQWRAPWRVSGLWRPRVFRTADDHGNPTVVAVLPLLGCLSYRGEPRGS